MKTIEQRESMIKSSVDFMKDGEQRGFLKVPHSVNRSAYGSIDIPIAVIKNGSGPTVLLTGGVHGDEYEGPIALSKLLQTIEPARITGRIIVIPALNFPAFLAASRVSPIDGVNLNRTFPGKRDGTVTEMIAHYVTEVLLSMADYSFDLHAGGGSLNYLPSILAPLPGDGINTARVDELLAAFTPQRVIRYDTERALSGEDRVFTNYANKKGVVFLSGEFGGGSSVNLDGLAGLEAGLVGYLIATGVMTPTADQQSSISGSMTKSAETENFMMDDPGLYAFANKRGFFQPAFRLGDELEAGAPAGFIFDAHDPWSAPTQVNFAAGGLALCIRTFSQVEPGDCLGHLGRRI